MKIALFEYAQDFSAIYMYFHRANRSARIIFRISCQEMLAAL